MNSLKTVSNRSKKNLLARKITYRGKEVSYAILYNFIKYWSVVKEYNSSGRIGHLGLEYSDFIYWCKLKEADKKFRGVYGNKIANELIKLIFNGLPYKITVLS